MSKQPENIQTAKDTGKYLLMAVALVFLYLKAAKPMLKKLSEAPALPPPGQAMHQHTANGELMALPGQRSYQDNLSRAQKMANEDPRVVANIVKTWVGSHE
jgi:flagellar M-ring protein FliF